MARPRRNTPEGYCYHVLSRGNARQTVFPKPADFEAFLRLFDAAHEIVSMRIVGFCLMPNHFHLVLWPREDGDLSRWMQWVLTTHVRRYHEHHQTSGHVWQGRFKAFPIQENQHLLSVLRYAERNPLRAKLVKSAADWPHSSLRLWLGDEKPAWYSAGPVSRGANWLKYVNQAETAAELAALRKCVARGNPYGNERWQRTTVAALGLESTLRPRGRPRKQNNEA